MFWIIKLWSEYSLRDNTILDLGSPPLFAQALACYSGSTLGATATLSILKIQPYEGDFSVLLVNRSFDSNSINP